MATAGKSGGGRKKSATVKVNGQTVIDGAPQHIAHQVPQVGISLGVSQCKPRRLDLQRFHLQIHYRGCNTNPQITCGLICMAMLKSSPKHSGNKCIFLELVTTTLQYAMMMVVECLMVVECAYEHQILSANMFDIKADGLVDPTNGASKS